MNPALGTRPIEGRIEAIPQALAGLRSDPARYRCPGLAESYHRQRRGVAAAGPARRTPGVPRV